MRLVGDWHISQQTPVNRTDNVIMVVFEEKCETPKWYAYIIVCFKSMYHSRLNAAL
jgi:hypothetical protein